METDSSAEHAAPLEKGGLRAYRMDGFTHCPLRTAPRERGWMDATPNKFAYRCLPVSIGNQVGWELLCPVGFRATWEGEFGADSIKLEFLGPPGPKPFVTSYFGQATLTFVPGYVFRVAEGMNIWVKGPSNRPKPGISPMEAWVEADWLPYPFNMTWIFTEPGEIEFAAGEPYCCFLPYPRGHLETYDPHIFDMKDDPAFETDFQAFAQNRTQFIEARKTLGSEQNRKGFQQDYIRGKNASGGQIPKDHQSKLRLRDFRDPQSPTDL